MEHEEDELYEEVWIEEDTTHDEVITIEDDEYDEIHDEEYEEIVEEAVEDELWEAELEPENRSLESEKQSYLLARHSSHSNLANNDSVYEGDSRDVAESSWHRKGVSVDTSKGTCEDDAPPVKKWFERYDDDPDDYEQACEKLIFLLYKDGDDYDDLETTLKRTTPKKLYRYLSQQYEYLKLTGQLDEDEVNEAAFSNTNRSSCEEEVEPVSQRPSAANGVSISDVNDETGIESNLRAIFEDPRHRSRFAGQVHSDEAGIQDESSYQDKENYSTNSERDIDEPIEGTLKGGPSIDQLDRNLRNNLQSRVDEEFHIEKKALSLKDSWLKEEAVLSLEHEALRTSHGPLSTSTSQQDVRLTHQGSTEVEEEAKRQAAVEEATRNKAEEEAKERAAAEEAARNKAEEEAKQRAAAEEAARNKAEEEAKQRAAEEETARNKAAEEAKRKAAAEEEARTKAEEEAKQRAAEEAARNKAEEEAKRKAAEEEAARNKAEDELKQRAAEEAARNKAEEEAKQRVAEEEAEWEGMLKGGILRILFLFSSTLSNRVQKANQDRALVILKSIGLDIDQVDGSDPIQNSFRERLFEISGIRAQYPQVFVLDTQRTVRFFGNFDSIEKANDSGKLRDAVYNLWNSEENGGTGSIDIKNLGSEEHPCDSESFKLVTNKQFTETERAPISKASYAKDLSSDGDSERLIARRENGKRLVNEKSNATAVPAKASSPAQVKVKDNVPTAAIPDPNRKDEDKPTTLAEKRRLIAEKRKRALATKASIREISSIQKDSDGSKPLDRFSLDAMKRSSVAHSSTSPGVTKGGDLSSQNIPGTRSSPDKEYTEHDNTTENKKGSNLDHLKNSQQLEALDTKNFPAGVWPTERLKWWRQNGKRLVEEKLNAFGKPSEVSAKNTVDESREDTTNVFRFEETKGVPETSLSRTAENLLEDKQRKTFDMGSKLLSARSGNPNLAAHASNFRHPQAPSTNEAMASRSKNEEAEDGRSLPFQGRNSNPIPEMDSSAEGKRPAAFFSPQSSPDKQKAQRLAEAERLAQRSARAREARLAREAMLAQETRNVKLRESLDSCDSPLEQSQSLDLSFASSTDGLAMKEKQSALIPQMVLEVDRLASYIHRYEKKLEAVCKSLLAIASHYESDKDAELKQHTSLRTMYMFLRGRDWFKENSSSKTPSFAVSEGNGSIESNTNLLENQHIQLTSIGSTFLMMDGPVEADIGRFLLSVKSESKPMKLSAMKEHWGKVSLLSRDAQSSRINDKVNELTEFCRKAGFITLE